MNLRRLLAVAVFLVLVPRLYLVAMRAGTTQCASPQLKSTWPCQKLSSWQEAEYHLKATTRDYASHVNRKIDELPFSRQIRRQVQIGVAYTQQKYAEAQVEEWAKDAAHDALLWAQTELYPQSKIWLRKSHAFLHSKSMYTYRWTSELMVNTIVPQTKQLASQLQQRGEQLLFIIWRKIQQSKLYQDVVAPQIQKIYDTVLDHENSGPTSIIYSASVSSASSSSSVYVGSTSASSTIASLITSSMVASPSATIVTVSNPDPIDELESAAYVRPNSTTVITTTVATSTINLDATMEPKSSEIPPFLKPVDPIVSVNTWFKRVQRTVDQAKVDLEKDSEEALEATIEDAKPEIMQMLRNLAKSSDDVIGLLSSKVDELDSRSEASLRITKEEIYEPYDAVLQDMATLTFEIRDRVEQLAKDCLAALDPIRSVTLDSMDDFFEIVLTEVARELSNRGEWDEFKDYNRLKQEMKRHRASLESHKFSMDVVNNALHESQTASLLIAQEAHKQLTNLRARAQLIFQEREKPNHSISFSGDETSEDTETEIDTGEDAVVEEIVVGTDVVEPTEAERDTSEDVRVEEIVVITDAVEPTEAGAETKEPAASEEPSVAEDSTSSVEEAETKSRASETNLSANRPPKIEPSEIEHSEVREHAGVEQATTNSAANIKALEKNSREIYVPEQEIPNDPFVNDIVVEDRIDVNHVYTVTQMVVA